MARAIWSGRGIDLNKVKVSERELEMAFTLIELLKRPFDPSEYKDHYREALARTRGRPARATRRTRKVG